MKNHEGIFKNENTMESETERCMEKFKLLKMNFFVNHLDPNFYLNNSHRKLFSPLFNLKFPSLKLKSHRKFEGC